MLPCRSPRPVRDSGRPRLFQLRQHRPAAARRAAAIEDGAAAAPSPGASPCSIGSTIMRSGAPCSRALAGVGPDAIALMPSVSYGVAVAARNLAAAPGQQVLLLGRGFPSDVYTWRAFAAEKGCRILTVSRPPGETWTDAVLAALDERVAVVAVPQRPMDRRRPARSRPDRRRAREVGAALVVDASQSFGVHAARSRRGPPRFPDRGRL